MPGTRKVQGQGVQQLIRDPEAPFPVRIKSSLPASQINAGFDIATPSLRPRRLVWIPIFSQIRGAKSSPFFRRFPRSITQRTRRVRTHGVQTAKTGKPRVARASAP